MNYILKNLQNITLAIGLVFGLGIMGAMSTPSFAASAVVDTFDEQTQTVTNGATASAGNVSTMGGPRQLLGIDGATSNVNVTPGQFDMTGARGDVRYGAGEAGQAALNLDWSAFTQYEIDVTTADFTAGHLQVGLYTNGGATIFADQNHPITTGTIVIPFSGFTDVGPAPTVTDLQDVDGAYIRFIAISGGTQNIVVTEWRVTDGAAVPEPSSIALAGMGLVGLIGWGLRRRRKA